MGGWAGLRNGWMGGFKEWVDGWAEGEGKGGVWGYEAYEVKNKKGKITLSFTSPEKEKYYIYIYEANEA